jgi:hypothetical protein
MYTDEQIHELEEELPRIIKRLDALQIRCVTQSHDVLGESRASEYLRFGAGRRVHVIRHCLRRIFELFPLDQDDPLPIETVTEVQVYLQASVINLYGLLDNWAWAFVLLHDLEE